MKSRALVNLTALFDAIAGGGLVLAATALWVVGELSSVSYARRMNLFEAASKASIASTLLAIGCAAALGMSRWRGVRILLVATCTIAVTFLIFEVGSLGHWRLGTLLILMTVGVALLASGVTLWQGRRWAGSIHLLLIVTALVACRWWDESGPIPILLLFAFLAFLVPVMPERPLGNPLARVIHGAAATALVLFLALTIGGVFLFAIFGARDFVLSHELTRQKITVANMWAIERAVNAYATDHNRYPEARDIAELARLLQPVYAEALPVTDGWGQPIDYRHVVNEGNEGYVIRSAGADGTFEQQNPTAYSGGAVLGFERDLVYSTITESQWPQNLDVPW